MIALNNGTCTNWYNLQAFPRKYCSQPVVLNENEFIVAMDVTYGEECISGDGIYVYYIKKNEWKLLIEYPTNYCVTCPSICYDFNNDLLYIYGGNRSLLIANINSKQCIVNINYNLLQVGWFPKSIMIDNEYNLICGESNKYHLLWNNKLQNFEKVYEFKDLLYGNANPGVVHLKSKNMIILFGGSDIRYEFASFSMNIDTIWKYTLNNNKWIKMDKKLPVPSDIFGYASSTDDRYIFIIGGRTYPDFQTVENDFIYVIDTQEWKMMKSQINCPQKGQYHSCIVPMTPTNNYLACGYVRRFNELCKLRIPLEILNVIS